MRAIRNEINEIFFLTFGINLPKDMNHVTGAIICLRKLGHENFLVALQLVAIK